MKKHKHVPESALLAIQTEHQKAIALMGDKKPIATLPIREVKMRIDRPSLQRQELETVIIPKTVIYYQGGHADDEAYYNRDGLRYFLETSKQPFPFGHIYTSSGSVCLGSIFVPSKISIHTPAQPLEALFLHNNHNVAHGNAQIKITNEQIQKVYTTLSNAGVTLTEDTLNTMIPNENLIRNDAPWIVSADVANQLPIERALYVMDIVFEIIFGSHIKK